MPSHENPLFGGNETAHEHSDISNLSATEVKVNTLKSSLEYFDLAGLLADLDISLEKVRRKEIEKKDHDQILKVVDKNLLKKSLNFHPDKVFNRSESQKAAENAHNLQSALNTTRTILRTLAELFLEDTDIDYRYEYLADYEINDLASETKIKLQIRNVLYKINNFSEIKRMRIIGEIRKFLLQSRGCLRSYSSVEKFEFKTQIGNVLYHLKNCNDGYESLNIEYNSLIKECSDEGDENMTSVIQKLAERSLKEAKQLKELETAARKCLERNSFRILKTEENVDEYYVLPFVLHLNAVLMCNAMLSLTESDLESGTSANRDIPNNCTRIWNYVSRILISGIMLIISFFQFIFCIFAQSNQNAHFINAPQSYEKAYDLLRRYEAEGENTKSEFNECLRDIEIFLIEKFKIDSYVEGKSNKTKIADGLQTVKEEMENIKEEKESLEKAFISCKNENEQILKQCKLILEKNEKLANEIQEVITQNKEAYSEKTEICEEMCKEIDLEKQFLDEDKMLEDIYTNEIENEKIQKQDSLNKEAKKAFKNEKLESFTQNRETHEELLSGNPKKARGRNEICERKYYESDMKESVLEEFGKIG